MLSDAPRAWEISSMATGENLRGKALYDALMRIKPDGLAETKWAIQSGLNKGFFSNLKSSNGSPSADNVRKLLAEIKRSEADLYGSAPDDPLAPQPNAVVQKFEGASEARMQQNLPIYGTALGADKIIDGIAIEQAHLNTGDIVGYAKRPVILDGRTDAYGIYVQGSSMDPAFEDGALILVETRRPARVTEYVVVYLRQNGNEHDADDGESARMVMVKKLVRRSASVVQLQQYNPPMTFSIPTCDVLKIHRVIPWGELLS
jgi:phage repressor protein C with HTH and peptisase S24 domain